MDAQPSIAEAISLAAMVSGLIRYLQRTRSDRGRERPLEALPWWALKDNCYMASLLGLDATLIRDATGTVTPLRDAAASTLESIVQHASDAKERTSLRRLREAVSNGLPYQYQRSVYRETGSFTEVVRKLTQRLESELAA